MSRSREKDLSSIITSSVLNIWFRSREDEAEIPWYLEPARLSDSDKSDGSSGVCYRRTKDHIQDIPDRFTYCYGNVYKMGCFRADETTLFGNTVNESLVSETIKNQINFQQSEKRI